eukprot:418152-Alexandrium_andersonii.AAC.1
MLRPRAERGGRHHGSRGGGRHFPSPCGRLVEGDRPHDPSLGLWLARHRARPLRPRWRHRGLDGRNTGRCHACRLGRGCE